MKKEREKEAYCMRLSRSCEVYGNKIVFGGECGGGGAWAALRGSLRVYSCPDRAWETVTAGRVEGRGVFPAAPLVLSGVEWRGD